jgi:hypothetical protein
METVAYIDFLQKPEFSLVKNLRSGVPAVGKLQSMNSVYRRDLENARRTLGRYFRGPSPRPCNCLLLGPPGSGKSFVAKQLQDFGSDPEVTRIGFPPEPIGKSASAKKVEFFEYNLSQLHQPEDLNEILNDIARARNNPKIVLLDEFDVRIGNTSVIRYLIEPMYEGKFGKTGIKKELGKTAFIFSGSYLSNKALLQKIQKEQTQIDLPRFLLEYYSSVSSQEVSREIISLFHMCDSYRKYQEEMAPESQPIYYLRQLDKLPDFLSRINGFVMELPDLSKPLEITEPPWILRGKVCDHAYLRCLETDGIAENIIKWVAAEKNDALRSGLPSTISGRFEGFETASEAILRYKDMLLKERLHILFTILDGERKPERLKESPPEPRGWTKHVVVVIKQSVLNYLCTVPLVHGMRSLKTLMWDLEAPRVPEYDSEGREQYFLEFGDPDVAARHIRQEDDYRNPTRLWNLIKAENKMKIEGDPDIRIVLDSTDPYGQGSAPALAAEGVLEGSFWTSIRKIRSRISGGLLSM